MKKEFVTYQQALRLKALGFDEPCMLFFSKELNMSIWLGLDERSVIINKEKEDEDFLIPTFSQAFRWFREKYGLGNHIWSGKISTVFYGYDILNIDEQEFVVNNSEIGGGDCDFETYEEAESACLDKLIEIVESNLN